jgi:hypothetical protein
MPVHSLRIEDFVPHDEDAEYVHLLAEMRCRFALDGNGRVYHVLAANKISDADLPLLFELRYLSQFCGWYDPPRQGDFTAAGFIRMVNHPTMERFTFEGNLGLTDDALRAIVTTDIVPYLGLSWTAITNDGVELLAGHANLQGLSLNGTEISDECVPFLCELRNLSELYITRTNVSPDSVAVLQSSLPSCRIVS